MPQDSSVKIRDNPWPAGSAVHPALVFAVIFVAIFLLHAPLLQLPYFWDEAGYYVPAARDILLNTSFIPRSTVSNAHPPLVLAWVALWWKCFGYAPLVARSAMLVVAAFSLTGLFRLTERAANKEVAIAATVCTALYPVFFAQSTLVQIDLAAAGLTFWGLHAYLDDHQSKGRPVAVAIWFSLAALAKETAILAPLALAAWQLLLCAPRFAGFGWRSASSAAESIRGRAALQGRENRNEFLGASAPASKTTTARRIVVLLVPIFPLTLWYAYHYARTGYVFGNPEFFRYNVASTLNPLRFLLALILRLWQTFGYMHLWLLTAAMLLALRLPPLTDHVGTAAPGCPVERSSTPTARERIAIPVQLVFAIVIAAYIIAMALIGGAELARYMLPAVPLVIILAVSTLRRRLRHWTIAIAVVALFFIAGWFWNPPYGFSPEDNLAYRDFIRLHENAEQYLEARYPMARVLTAWPASGELTSPWLGYVTRPMQVVQIENFSLDEILSAADFNRDATRQFDVALVFSTKYDPPHPWLERWKKWAELNMRFFGYHRDLPPAAAAQILGGRIVYAEERKGQWIAVIEIQRDEIQSAANLAASVLR
jgi:Dolichyl-phosphate-mannose-protein mannosyltransferase